MQRIYGARDSIEAEFVKGLLDAEDIRAVVQGSALEGARGDIPFTAASLPSVWVNEADVPRAIQIVDEFRRGGPAAAHPTAPWKCLRCGEVMEGQFTSCWKCGAERPAEGSGQGG
jgi:hypothetical protein